MVWSDAATQCWHGIARHAKNAVVCLDAHAHASLHWNAGQVLFYSSGATCVTVGDFCLCAQPACIPFPWPYYCTTY